jgi:hypothetical protein
VKDASARSKASASLACDTGSIFVKNLQQLQQLQAAAARTQDKALAAALTAGVGYHHAAMEPSDRNLVEELFKDSQLHVGSRLRLRAHCSVQVVTELQLKHEQHKNAHAALHVHFYLMAISCVQGDEGLLALPPCCLAGDLYNINPGYGSEPACQASDHQRDQPVCWSAGM